MQRDRYQNLDLIQQLDPERDHCQIYHLMNGYEFPWDITRSLEVALMRTYCIPSISKLLNQTGEFIHRPQKRYDDTSIIVVEIVKWGYDSDRGKQALERMNAIHRRFKIDNADFLYVLSTFVYEPIRWNERFGWRLMCEQEKLAAFYFWREVGKRMEIQNIPETYAEFERYNLDYERQNFHYSDTNRRVGEATRDLFLSWFPWWMRSLLTPFIYALLDDTMINAFGFPHPSPLLRSTVASILKLRAKFLRLLPPRTQPDFFIDAPIRTYPKGYEIGKLGPAENIGK
ncbi:oxygenase MpaB family protein [Anabaena sp. 4-3]|uniref:oxygenase MpaB family protein n=1 Tax=Anabaena sp. 4-3 TaxID=1811979 RepID=UPI00082D81C0|nr:oxygenase MpaB family protein [Anabaena sp. 4-3]